MKQKFIFKVDKAENILKLSEAAEADAGTFIHVHQESYDLQEMIKAAQHGQSSFIEKMRRRNLFPPFDLAVKLFEAARDMFNDGSLDETTVEYEDIDGLPLSDEAIHYAHITDDEEDVEIDELLKDDPDDLSEDDIKEIDSDDDTPRFETDDDSELEN